LHLLLGFPGLPFVSAQTVAGEGSLILCTVFLFCCGFSAPSVCTAQPIAELETEVAINVALNRLREGGQEGPGACTMGFIELKG